MEALGSAQEVATNGLIAFDPNTLDSVGSNITLDETGTIFTITRPGLYHVEWNLNLATGGQPAVVGILENGEPATGTACSTPGSCSSGTLIEVTTVPFTLSLHNYGNPIVLEEPTMWENSAASIRIVRFADAPSM